MLPHDRVGSMPSHGRVGLMLTHGGGRFDADT